MPCFKRQRYQNSKKIGSKHILYCFMLNVLHYYQVRVQRIGIFVYSRFFTLDFKLFKELVSSSSKHLILSIIQSDRSTDSYYIKPI